MCVKERTAAGKDENENLSKLEGLSLVVLIGFPISSFLAVFPAGFYFHSCFSFVVVKIKKPAGKYTTARGKGRKDKKTNNENLICFHFHWLFSIFSFSFPLRSDWLFYFPLSFHLSFAKEKPERKIEEPIFGAKPWSACGKQNVICAFGVLVSPCVGNDWKRVAKGEDILFLPQAFFFYI